MSFGRKPRQEEVLACSSSMGPVKCKPDPPPREVVEEETSNGFHVFELHMPTMGANIILIVIIVLAFASCWRLKFCRSLLRRREGHRRSFSHQPHFELHPLPPATAQATPPAAAAAPPTPAPDYWSPTIALLAENFVRAMGAAQVTYEDEPRPRIIGAHESSATLPGVP
jgi:hypothetical protein